MRISATLPEHASIVEAVLDGFVQAAAIVIRTGGLPPHPRDAGVVYREETGTENWLLPNQVLAVGWGDCEDLAIWAAGGYRATGEDDAASVAVLQTGPHKVHAVVRRGDGTYEDVARSLVMRQGRSVLGAAPPRRTGETVRVRVHAPSGASPFAGLAPAAAPADGGTPLTPQQKAELDLAAWMQANGRTDVTINSGYKPSAGDRAPAEFQRLAQQLAQRMSDERRPDALLQQQYAKQQGMKTAADLGEQVRTVNYGQSVRTPGAPEPWGLDPTGAPLDPTVDPMTGLPYGYDQYANPYGYDQYAALYGGFGFAQPQPDYDYQALSDRLYAGGVSGEEQQPWQVDVDGDGDVDAEDYSADWLEG